jgi:hypothetical protein
MEIPRDELTELKKRTKSALPLMMGATIPIIRFDETPESIASGVLVDVGPEPVMLTAAHVADRYYRGEYLVTLRGKDGRGTIPLGPPMMLRSPRGEDPDRHDDPFDIAILRFPPEIQKALRDQFTPAPARMLVNDRGDGTTFYAAWGFPRKLSPTKALMSSLHINPMYTVGLLANPDVQMTPPYAPDVELLLRYEPGEDPEGNHVEPLDPDGMSGCGLWRITRRPRPGTAWTVDDVALVGVVHTLNKEPSLLRSTQIHYAKVAIDQSFRENPVYVSPLPKQPFPEQRRG